MKQVVTMKELNTHNLSDKAVKLLVSDCENKIKHCEADLDDYDLFVKCQRELLKRQMRREILERNSEQPYAFF
jgi:hypothetical protein